MGVALDEEFTRITTTIVSVHESVDGTVKFLIKLQDGHEVEAVIIDHTGRLTLCVSSQVGCRMGCTFCATGTLGLSGNLLAGEILEQIWHANAYLSDSGRKITNIVFMGMGEPLENYENVVSAIRGFIDPHRFAIGDTNITVSTVGLISNIYRLMEDCPSVNLALSLHAPTQAIRELIVPSATAYPLPELMKAVDYYNKNQKFKGKRKGNVMMEYVVIKNVNDSPECAHALGKLLYKRKCMVNLIPYNPFQGNAFEEPTEESVQIMSEIISSYQVVTIIRKHHGRDIAGACGQLAKISNDLEDLVQDTVLGVDLSETKKSNSPSEILNKQEYENPMSESVEFKNKLVGPVILITLIALAVIIARRNS